ncbi:MAG: isochorismatase family cysteine hydrolase [Beijerinckiaceae bacterium]|jgi:nicotinamidase-related amidase|nr:isochorismatase family cysteine hydrolase [Beijerinckiaceae bacterium]
MAHDEMDDCPVPLTLDDFLRPSQVALVMWDFQKGLAGKALHVDRIKAAAQTLLDGAERHGVPVIWSRHILPPLDLTNGPFLLFLMKKQKVDHPDQLAPTMQPGMEDTEFLDGLAPAPHHIVLEKSQPSLFVDTPLDNRLKTLGVKTLVLAGVATDIGIEFTARHAAALGYYSVIAEDATGSYTAQAQARSIEFLRSWTSPVTTAAEICRSWDEDQEAR